MGNHVACARTQTPCGSNGGVTHRPAGQGLQTSDLTSAALVQGAAPSTLGRTAPRSASGGRGCSAPESGQSSESLQALRGCDMSRAKVYTGDPQVDLDLANSVEELREQKRFEILHRTA
jgi:hypothetical protein